MKRIISCSPFNLCLCFSNMLYDENAISINLHREKKEIERLRIQDVCAQVGVPVL